MSILAVLWAQRPGSEWRGAAVLASALALGLAGCSRAAGGASAPSRSQAASTEASYLAPPRAVSVQLGREGALVVTGSAPRGSVVKIMSPEGEQARATADAGGRWTLRLAGAAQPRLYAISAMLAGRIVHAEGALVTAPGAVTPAVTVRAGYAAAPLGPTRPTGIDSVDYDPSGFIAVAGSAPSRAQLTLLVDGTPAAVGQADAAGRYALVAANRRLSMGLHQLAVREPDGAPVRNVTLEPPAPLTTAYQAWRESDGWRVEWALNGGGVQTTLILDR